MEFIAGNSIHKHFESMDRHLSNISKKCEKIHNKLDEDIKALTNEVELYRGMVHAIAEAIPDMLWFKDTNGVYIYMQIKQLKMDFYLTSTLRVKPTLC